MFEITPAPFRPHKHPARAGLLTSLLLHTLVVGAAVAIPLAWLFNDDGEDNTITVVATISDQPPSEPETVEVQAVSDPSEVTGVMVDEKLNEVIAESQQMTDQEKLDRLTMLAQRVEQVSTEQSIDELTGQFHKWFGTQPRATQPAAAPVAGPFDFDTAQLHDVKREAGENGGFRYIATLLDAEGRTLEVELNEAEGETMFETMERLKAFPLADKIYRQITMPLMDNLIKAGQQASDASRKYEEEMRKAEAANQSDN